MFRGMEASTVYRNSPGVTRKNTAMIAVTERNALGHSRGGSGTRGDAPTTVETWFGPRESSLFGVLHIPASETARGAVAICPPLAREHIPSYRGLRQLADFLAEEGFAVLRFDYRGQGDSVGNQADPDAVNGWLDSAEEAVSYLEATVDAPVSLIGVRAGALLASRILERIGPLRTIVLLDPVVSGRRYVREQLAQYAVMVGEDDASDERRSVIGAAFHPRTVDQLSTLSIDGSRVAEAAADRLVVLRDTDVRQKAMASLLSTSNADSMVVSRLDTFTNPASFVFSVPTNTFRDIATWISARGDDAGSTVTPVVNRTAQVGLADDGTPIVETIGYRGPHRLLSFTTEIEGSPPRKGLVVLHQTAAEHRIGPARLWVEGGRYLASRGVRSIRYDRRGTGDSGAVAHHERTSPTSTESCIDVNDIATGLDSPASRTVHAGICSGAWHAAYAARNQGAAAVVMMNMAKWSLRNTRVPVKAAHVDALDSTAVTTLFEFARTVRNFGRALLDSLPNGVWRVLGRAGVVDSPELLLGSLVTRGVRTVTLLSPEDTRVFDANRGRSALTRLRRRDFDPEVTIFRDGDHSLYQRDLRDTMFAHLVDVVDAEIGTHTTEAGPVRPFTPSMSERL